MAAKLIQQFRAHRPDITLMDLQMPEMNGLDAIIAIRGEFPAAKIIVLTTYKGDVQILRALKAGAHGYLLKNTFDKELIETIRAVHARKKALSPEASYEIAEHATDDALTPAEIKRNCLLDGKLQNDVFLDRTICPGRSWTARGWSLS